MTPTQPFAAVLVFIVSVLALYVAGRVALSTIARVVAGPEPIGWVAGRWRKASPLVRRFIVRYPRGSSLIVSRLDPHRFTGLPLTLMVLAAIYLVGLFGGLVEDLLSNEGVVRLDVTINDAFAPWRTPTLVKVFLWITALGSNPTIVAVAASSSGLLFADQRRELLLPLWTTLIGAEATTWAGKFLIDRQRPAFIEAASALSPSFPSAHSTGAMAVYGFLAYLIARDLSSARRRFEVGFWTTILIVLVGFSRIFLSVHFTSDVLSGLVVGAFWLLVGFALAEGRRAKSEAKNDPATMPTLGSLSRDEG